MTRHTLSLFLVLCACESKSNPIIGEDSGGGEDGGVDGGSDGGETGTDNDGDGYTAEDGDCNDDDFRINPAWPEEEGDGIDNDCDGRIDELWRGFVAATQRAEARSSLVFFDTVGRIEDEVNLGEGVVPWTISEDGRGSWLVTTYPYFYEISASFSLLNGGLMPSYDDSVAWYQPSQIWRVGQDGSSELLATIGDADYDGCMSLPEEDWPDCFGELDPKSYFYGPYVRGTAPHPDGWTAVLTPGALLRLDTDGSVSELASWGWNMASEDVPFEMYGSGIAVDPATGTVAILDLIGGFATWTQEGGLVFHKKIDLASEELDLETIFLGVGLCYMERDGWYALNTKYTTGDHALRRFEDAGGEWREAQAWADPLIQPLGVAAEGTSGDWYATSKAGEYRTIFRIRSTDGSVDDFFNEVESDVNYWGIATRL